MGHKPSYYRRFFDRRLCDVKRSFKAPILKKVNLNVCSYG
jgi:hypothetical protein